MLMPEHCWIDGSECHALYENLTLEHCKLCQETRYNLKQLKLKGWKNVERLEIIMGDVDA
jgi:hypothetical protein